MWGKENKNGVIIFENGSVMQFLIMTKTIDGLITLYIKRRLITSMNSAKKRDNNATFSGYRAGLDHRVKFCNFLITCYNLL